MKWEYEILPVSRQDLVVDCNLEDLPRFNVLGAQGWELVAVYNGSVYFKRPLVDTATADLPTYQPKRIIDQQTTYDCPRENKAP